MHSVGRAYFVGFPDVNLRAAAPILAATSIDIRFTGIPIVIVGFTIDELHVMRALSITVAKAKFGASIALLALATIPVHLDKVQSTIEATIEVGVVHGVCELLVFQMEMLISIII